MGNTTEIKSRISSIQEIMKITNAMYIISSSKLKKARVNLSNTEPYYQKIQSILQDVLESVPDIDHIYFEKREEIPEDNRKKGYVVITADKGLAGGYNHNVIKRAEQEMGKSENITLFVVGQVGRLYFQRRGIKIDKNFHYTTQNPTLFRAQLISEELLDLFKRRELDDIYLIFNEMVTSVNYEVRVKRLFPMERIEFNKQTKDRYVIFDPSPRKVMDKLIPNYIKGYIFGVLVEAFSSEQSARMIAMESATNSAKDTLDELNLEFKRARQSAITQEITEISSAAKSFGGGRS